MRVLQRRARDHHPVRVEGSCRNRREPFVLQEAGVRLKVGQVLAAVEVEKFDDMAFGTTAID